jgi:hypothetical protein
MAIARRPLLAMALAFALLVAACGDDGQATFATAPESSGSPAPLTPEAFTALADVICMATASRFGELEDPDGVGGAKPLGLGTFMRDWTADLRTLPPPATVAEDWNAGLDLLDRAANALDRAEAGDPDAQSEALWALEPRAQRHFRATGLPFQVCFVE